MNLKGKRFGFIIALIVISLTGLIILQFYLLSSTIQQKRQAFDANVMAALNLISSKLETREMIAGIFLTDSYVNPDSISTQITADIINFSTDSLCDDTLIIKKHWIPEEYPIYIKDSTLQYVVKNPQHVLLEMRDIKSNRDTILVDGYRNTGVYTLTVPKNQTATSYSYSLTSDSMTFAFNFTADDSLPPALLPRDSIYKHQMVLSIINRLGEAEWQPIENRITSEELDTVIGSSLIESGIDLKPEFGVISPHSDSLPIVTNENYKTDLLNSDFKTQLFPNDFYADHNELALFFPQRQVFIWKQITPLVISTLIFMLIIIYCFIYTIRRIYVQKRFAGRMVDFINNMTHEFKTPISTVALASEAIDRPDIISQSDKVARYNQMIRDENRRMRGQVEKILQMAVLEEGDYELNRTDIDLNELIRKAVDNISLQTENHKGKISFDLKAEKHFIKADTVHMTNIIHNLLDNAVKYSQERPEIEVSTHNRDNGIVIIIADHGIGIDEKVRKYVFDKYYRVSSGNVHNVKGFGLGLTYVKLMTEAQGGEIKLHSRENVGTTVELYFPEAFKME